MLLQIFETDYFGQQSSIGQDCQTSDVVQTSEESSAIFFRWKLISSKLIGGTKNNIMVHTKHTYKI